MSQLSVLPDLADQINDHHAAAQGLAQSAMDRAYQCGEALMRAKGQLGHGEWLPWLKAHTDVSERTARRYMQVTIRRSEIELKSATDAVLSLNEMVDLISVPRKKAALIQRLDDLTIEERRRAVLGFDGGWKPYHRDLLQGFVLAMTTAGQSLIEVADYLGISLNQAADGLKYTPTTEWQAEAVEHCAEMDDKEARESFGHDCRYFERRHKVRAHWFAAALIYESRPDLCRQLHDEADRLERERYQQLSA